jgi:hypothetical protein
MSETDVLQWVRKMLFEAVYRGWQKGRFKVEANLLKSVGHEQKPNVRNHER